MAGEVSVSGGKITTPAGNAPLVPVILIAAGLYVLWYAVHYWRDEQQVYPSDPLKSFLTGKGLPAPKRHASISEALNDLTPTGGGGTRGAALPTGVTSSAIANAALKYQGQGYVYGGPADRPGNWDCSSFVSYVLGHDLGLPLPGGRWGQPGFPPNSHGPTTTEYLSYGTQINRSQVQAGDLIVWADHIAIAVSSSEAISAHSPSLGTSVTGIDAENSYHGGNASYRRVAAGAGGATIAT